jgi:hypothetical protein
MTTKVTARFKTNKRGAICKIYAKRLETVLIFPIENGAPEVGP